MVLQELGQKLKDALNKLNKSDNIDQKLLKEMLTTLSIALIKSDVNLHLVKKLTSNIQSKFDEIQEETGNKKLMLQKAVVKELQNMLTSKKKPYTMVRGKPNVVMFVGLQGSGKTTTITKLALYYKNRGYRPAVIAADTFRAGAYEQLQMNAKKAGVPFFGMKDESDPVKVAKTGVETFKKEKNNLILVDTSGRHKQDSELFKEMQDVKKAINPDSIIFVMDGAIGQAAFAQAKAFKDAVDVGSVIITKLDGHANGGGALSAVAATGSPIIFIGTGEKVKEIEEFDAESFVRKLLGMSDIRGVAKLAQEFAENKEYKTMVKHLKEGNLTIRDWKEQLTNLQKMGQLGSIMQMIGFKDSQLAGDSIEKKFKNFMVILDSMTDRELDGNAKTMLQEESRLQRIARGSGRDMREVLELFEQIKMFQKCIDRLPKSVRQQLTNSKASSGNMSEAAMMEEVKKMLPRGVSQAQLNQVMRQLQSGQMPSMGGRRGKR